MARKAKRYTCRKCGQGGFKSPGEVAGHHVREHPTRRQAAKVTELPQRPALRKVERVLNYCPRCACDLRGIKVREAAS